MAGLTINGHIGYRILLFSTSIALAWRSGML
jgi:hypothetical protein